MSDYCFEHGKTTAYEPCPECNEREALRVQRLVIPTPLEAQEAFDAWYHGLPGCEQAYLRNVDYKRGWDAAVTWMMESVASDKSG